MAGLDFNFDPFKSLSDPIGNLGFGGGGRRGAVAKPEYRQPLAPEESASLGKQILDTGTSGVTHVLGALDKPGQVVRGLFAGKGLSSLKHIVPFAHSMGLTTDADHTTGRDLTDQYGLTSKHDQGWGAWGAGLAADIATDPLSYATFGAKHALTPIGLAVKKTGALGGFTGKRMLQGFQAVEPALLQSGKTASDIEHLIDKGHKIATGAAAQTGVKAGQPLASLARIGLPFGGPGVNVGTGKTAQKIAGGLDAAGDYFRYGNPVGRAIGSLFDSTRHGAVDKITQKGAADYLDPALQGLKADARQDRFGLIGHLDPLVTAYPRNEVNILDAARASAEGVPSSFSPQALADAAPAAGHVRSVAERQLAEACAAGAPIKELGDPYARYVHRSAFDEHPGSVQLGGKGASRNQGLLPTTSGANIGRQDLFRNIPGGTHRINDWWDRFAGLPKQKATVANAVKKDMVADLHAGGNLLTYTDDLDTAFDVKATLLAKRLAKSNPAHRTTADQVGKPLFSPDLVSNVTQRGAQHAKTVANTKAAIGIMTDHARLIDEGNPEKLVPLHEVARRIGLGTYRADAKTGTPMQGALVQIYKGLAKHGEGKVDPFLAGKIKTLRAAVNQYGLTPEHAEQLTKAYGQWNAPEQIKSGLGAFDSVTNAFKALAYPIWLPSHVRNAATAGLNNLRHGVGWNDYRDQLQVMTGRGSRDLSGIHASLAGLTPAQQIDALRGRQYRDANIFGGNGMNDEIAGNVSQGIADGQRFTPQLPGSDRLGPTGNLLRDTADLAINQGIFGTAKAARNAVREGFANISDPTLKWGQSIGYYLGIRGVGGAAKDALPAVAAGRKIGTNIEDFFRGALHNRLSRQGYTGIEAGRGVNDLHFDYDALTGFEKNVMRRAMPFYTFARKNLPLQVDTALHSPGILQAQSKPFNQPDPDGKGYVPKYLDSGFAMPLGPEKDGSRQYISKFGLPAEEAFDKLHFQNGMPDFRRTALSYLGGMNPLVKAPLEQLFNTQFHTQRQLSDLRAPAAASALGRLIGDDNPQLLSQVLANSPATRFVSSADKLMDPRKSWLQKAANLASGVKVTDVDVDKQRAIDTRNALAEILKQQPNISQYSSFYVKPEDSANLTAAEIELMRMYATQQKAARDYAKFQRIGIKP